MKFKIVHGISMSSRSFSVRKGLLFKSPRGWDLDLVEGQLIGSQLRELRLRKFLSEVVRLELHPQLKVLEVGPSAEGLLSRLDLPWTWNADFHLIDLQRPRWAGELRSPHQFNAMSIDNLQYNDGYFDVVICNHVLPYVENYKKALKELFRVLKSEGVAMIENETWPGRTRPFAEVLAKNPESSAWEWGEKYGNQWIFGEDMCGILREQGFTPLRFRSLDLDKDLLLAFKSLTKSKFQDICHLKPHPGPVHAPIEAQ